MVQNYPRLDTPARSAGLLDVSQLKPHHKKFPEETLRRLIREAIRDANLKSSREILAIETNATAEELSQIYRREGRNLFKYFKQYCGDPAATAHQVYRQHYSKVAKENFRNRTLQKERMNSGWRYQFLALDCAVESQRFRNVSEIGLAEADFNAVIDYIDSKTPPLSLFVSVKNRTNTMGGQDWPKAIHALENVASNDKNRRGLYCCVFGIAMEQGTRLVKNDNKTKRPHSPNTEVWKSDFFWPFFANYSYREIMTAFLDVLMEAEDPDEFLEEVEVPDELIDSFGRLCKNFSLTDEEGYFNNPYTLVDFFCNPMPRVRRNPRNV